MRGGKKVQTSLPGGINWISEFFMLSWRDGEKLSDRFGRWIRCSRLTVIEFHKLSLLLINYRFPFDAINRFQSSVHFVHRPNWSKCKQTEQESTHMCTRCVISYHNIATAIWPTLLKSRWSLSSSRWLHVLCTVLSFMLREDFFALTTRKKKLGEVFTVDMRFRQCTISHAATIFACNPVPS